MPEHPIYIPLLPEAAQQAIGKVHQHTEPALAMLLKEGFRISNMVDIFDGGATVICETRNIRTIQQSLAGTISAIVEQLDKPQTLVSNTSMDFRACLGHVDWRGESAIIDQVTALRLKVRTGDRVRAAQLRPDKES
jgi:arginine N-succinyltransferase